MQYNKLIYTTAISALSLFFSACKNNASNNCANIMCTEEFRTFGVVLLNTDSSLFNADSVLISDAFGVTLKVAPKNTTDGSYTLVSDGESFLNQDENKNVIVKVLKNNATKITANYTFTKDCCHVSKLSGADTLIIN